ncbi:MAG TPA: 50S ribosomal protein L15 [Candidatus Paceibacterota bacterium]|nr:50S ribosomal protein L15 [Candidatus Paceibacterota bacterium]
MQFNNVQRKTQRKRAVQVGRGGTRGKTSGRGTKGQKARAGHKIRPEIRDLIKKLPKLRGRGTNYLKSVAVKPTAVNLSVVEAVFKAGDKVTPSTLAAKGVVPKISGKISPVKILAAGELTKKFTIAGCEVSAGAREKIEKAGGKITP